MTIEQEIAALRQQIADAYEAALRGLSIQVRPIRGPFHDLVAILGEERARQVVREVMSEVEARVERLHYEALEEIRTIENVERWVYGRHKL